MKNLLLLFFVFTSVFVSQGESKNPLGTVVITSDKDITQVHSNEKGELIVNVSPNDILKFKENKLVKYSDFGAKGDGKTDDIEAIAGAHAYANEHSLKVKADDGASYYIGKKDRTAYIQTDTDFGTATFIIDDTNVDNLKAAVFTVNSNLKPFKLEGIATLKRNQKKINASLPGTSLITVSNSNVKHYIRYGSNQDNGSAQSDIFIVDKNGKVDMDAPIIWDFDEITEIMALPIDEETLTITGGHFITIANKAESKYNYYSRNLLVNRSNVIIDGLEHKVTGEGEHGAPYGGFLSIRNCSYVTVKNTILTGHKTYSTIGSAGNPVTMGTYDILVGNALNVSFINCSQTNDIDDRDYWGIMGSNYCKNLLFDNCTFSRFDAHKGVANATIRNSTLGHMGINAIGSGTLLVENSTLRGRSIVNLRSDYGSTWQGELIIRNCVFIPNGGKSSSAALISGSYSGQHNFGYTSYMPEKITIENLQIDDSNHPEDYNGPVIFTNFNSKNTNASYQEKYPYVLSKKVILKDVTTKSGKEIRLSENSFMFNEIKVIRK